MPTSVSNLWTDERIDATVTPAFVTSHFILPQEQELLHKPLTFGGGLTDDTYLDWILTRAKRLFLILVDIKLPDQIFGLVDESYDDADLPIAFDVVKDLRLSEDPDRELDRKFYRAQFRFLIKPLKAGEHVRYTSVDTIPVEPVGLKAGIVALGKDGLDKVRLASSHPEVYARKRVVLNQAGNLPSETDVLSEVSCLKQLVHPHLVSIYGSYLDGDSVYALLTPTAEYTLKSFTSDPPKAFESLPKRERREILINWPHCLANAMDWLHGKGLNHGAVRPSNVHVTSSFTIFLGQYSSYDLLHSKVKPNVVESYQYAAPERWRRAAKVQTSGPGKVALPSGGRTARKPSQSQSKDAGSVAATSTHRLSWGANSRSTVRASIDTVNPPLTIQTFESVSQAESVRPVSERSTPMPPPSLTSSSSSSSKKTSDKSNKIPSVRPSYVMSDTAGDGSTVRGLLREPAILAPPEVRTTVVQTWHSLEVNPLPADIFALGAIIMDILTFICDKGAGSFTRFRSAKNRTAGRGGGLADASFHANLGQVEIWANSLIKEAKKKAKKDDGQAFQAVEPIIELTRLCLERDPECRIKADELEKRIAECLIKAAGYSKLHCYRTFQATTDIRPDTHAFSPASPGNEIFTDPSTAFTSEFAAPTSTRNTRPRKQSAGDISPTALQSSYSSLSSFNFEDDFLEYDDDLDVGIDDEDYDENWLYRKDVIDLPSSFGGDPLTADAGFPKRPGLLERHYSEDSRIDPSLIISPDERGNGDGDGYDSDDSHHKKTFFLPESRPASMLPPIQGLKISEQIVSSADVPPAAAAAAADASQSISSNNSQTRLSSVADVKRPSSTTSSSTNTTTTVPPNAASGEAGAAPKIKANFSRLKRTPVGP